MVVWLSGMDLWILMKWMEGDKEGLILDVNQTNPTEMGGVLKTRYYGDMALACN